MIKLWDYLDKIVFKEKKNWLLIIPIAVIYMWLAAPTSFSSEIAQLALAQTTLQNRIFGAIFYICTAFICAVSILLFGYAKGKANIVIFTVLFFFIILDLSYTSITGHHFNLSEYIFFLNEFRQTANALTEYLPSVVKYSLILLPFYIAILFSKRFIVIELRFLFYKYVIFVCAVLLVCASMSFSHAKRDNYITAPRVFGVALYAAMNSDYLGTNLPYAPRVLPADVTPQAEPGHNIILVIDESVTAHYLGINGYPADTTPFLRQHPELYINFGLATSATNASNTSNYMLRNGLTPKNWPQPVTESFSWPSLFSYAKRAGMHTIMIDSQQGASSLQNYMSVYDLRDIDEMINLSRESGLLYAMDIMALDKVQEIIAAQQKPCFVVLVKMGIHFPYYLRYPRENAVFTPDYDKNSAIVDTVRYQGTPEGAERHLNTYLNSVRYCVDDYLAYATERLNLRDTLLLYTSDHGQSINSATPRAAHNTWPQVAPEQLSVPILLMGEKFHTLFSKEPVGTYSNFQLFPSILRLMGYGQEVSDKYGPALWDADMEQQGWVGPLFSPGGRMTPLDPNQAEIAVPGEEFAQPATTLPSPGPAPVP